MIVCQHCHREVTYLLYEMQHRNEWCKSAIIELKQGSRMGGRNG